MSGLWRKMEEKEMETVKGKGSPCYTVPSSILGKYSKGSCQPAYEINQILTAGSNSSGLSSSKGHICTSR